MVEKKIKRSLRKLYKGEKEIFMTKNGVNEVTVTHHLAKYLEKSFPKYKVDIEYNRQGVDIKTDIRNKKRFPDIVVHKRKILQNSKKDYDPKSNYIIIEVKGWWNREVDGKNRDKEKIKKLKEKFGYQYGYFVELREKDYSLERI